MFDEAKKIQEFLTRGIEKIYPNADFLQSKLARGEKLTLYLGIDPTAPTLHLGHAIILLKLKTFQELGHKVVLLIGDFTGTVGDPTDKTATRKKLTRTEVLYNARLYKKQASTFLKFSGKNPAILAYNSKWLRKMHFGDVLELASLVTVDQMLKRDMFDLRMKEGKPIHLHEFLYPVLQGYDSVALETDGEIGGNDQTFNMLMGRDLEKQILSKEKFVMTVKLLADGNGKKMGKSEGNMVALNEKPDVMFGKIMSWTDGMILPVFELCTEVSQSDIEEIRKSLAEGANPRDSKVRLAGAIVELFHGKQKAIQARENFFKTFSQKQVPQEVKTVTVQKNILLVDILLNEKLVTSRGEWKRLVGEQAISELFEGGEGVKILDFNFKLEKNSTFKIGKHRFIKVHVI